MSNEDCPCQLCETARNRKRYATMNLRTAGEMLHPLEKETPDMGTKQIPLAFHNVQEGDVLQSKNTDWRYRVLSTFWDGAIVTVADVATTLQGVYFVKWSDFEPPAPPKVVPGAMYRDKLGHTYLGLQDGRLASRPTGSFADMPRHVGDVGDLERIDE